MRQTFQSVSSFVYRARWRIFVVLSPALVTLILLLFQIGMPLTSFMPFNNDEHFIYKLVSSMLSDGLPLGYFGYNETHALHGTFGAWGIASVFPYAAFGLLFGWHPYSPLFANITFLCGANLLFVLMARPKNKELKYLFLINLLHFSASAYTLTGMNECNRMALSIVLCGAFCRLLQGGGNWLFRYLLVPVLLFGAIQIFMPFVILVPLYFWIIIPKKRWWLSIPASLLVCMVLVAIYFALEHYTQAPYYEPEQSARILEAVKTLGILKAIPFTVSLLMSNLRAVDPAHLLPSLRELAGVSMFLFWAMLFAGAYLLLQRKKPLSSRDKGSAWILIYLLGGYLTAYCLMYDTRLSRIARGIFIISVFAMYFSCMMENKTVVRTFAVLSCVFLFTLNSAILDMGHMHFLPEETLASLERYRAAAAQVVTISKENKRWDNTIALYLNPTHALYCMPDNAGLNLTINNYPTKGKAKYALLNKEKQKPETVNKFRETLQKKAYIPILETELFVLYERQPAQPAALTIPQGT